MGNSFQSQTAINEISAITNVINESIQKLDIKASNQSVNVNKVEVKVCEGAIIEGDLNIDITQKIKSFNKLDGYSVIQTLSQNWNQIQNSLEQLVSQLATSKQGWLSTSNSVANQYQQNISDIFNEIISRTESDIKSVCQQYIENFNNGKITVCGVIKEDVNVQIEQDIYNTVISSCVIDSLFNAINQNYVANSILQRGDQIEESIQEGITGAIFAFILLILAIGAVVIIYMIVKKNKEKELKKQEAEALTLGQKLRSLQMKTDSGSLQTQTSSSQTQTSSSQTQSGSSQAQTSSSQTQTGFSELLSRFI
jgi:nitric oxide reductase large subunit